MTAWQRIIRFEADDGKVHYGEPILDTNENLDDRVRAGTLSATVLEGDVFGDTCKLSDQVLHVQSLLGLLDESTPIIRCVGLNYLDHGKARLLHLYVYAIDMSSQGSRRRPTSKPRHIRQAFNQCCCLE